MSEAAVIAQVLFHAVLIGALGEPVIGDGAYYNQLSLQGVCEWRNENGWGPELNCEWDCLAAWGRYEPEMLGEYVAAYLPGGGYRL